MYDAQLQYHTVPNVDSTDETIRRLDTALKFAERIIERYEKEIDERFEVLPNGFCRGCIFMEAQGVIKDIVAGKRHREGL